jgi:predicted naringenin-chalcone synthase
LYGLGTAVPPHSSGQPQVQKFMTELARAAHGGRAAKTVGFIEKIYSASGIEKRHSVLPDYVKEDPAEFEFYPTNWALDPFPSTAARMKVYERESVVLAAEAARKALAQAGATVAEVTHLIVTTCTGFFAPGPDIMLLETLGLRPDCQRTLIGFMGCYAGFNAMKTAGHIVASDPEAVVLCVSVELCSLHFQKRPEFDFMIGNSLFADGAGAAVFAAAGRYGRGVADLAASYGRVAPDSLGGMSWHIGDTGFEMRLDPGVPKTLHKHAPDFARDLLSRAGLARDEVSRWAVHPGGRRIIEGVAEALTLDDGQTRSSRAVLAANGNMSSATIFFVLAEELRSAVDSPVAALGFGPGLTMEGAVFAPPAP